MKKEKGSRLMAFILCVSLVFIFTGCSAQNEKLIRINNSNVYVDGCAILTEKFNLLDPYLPEGYKVEWTHISSGPDIRDGIISGQIDMAGLSLMTYISALDNNLPLCLICFYGSTPIYMFSSSDSFNGFDSVVDSERIAITNKGTNLHMAFLAECYEHFGETQKFDFKLSSITAAEALAAMQTSDDYDAGIFSFPMSVRASESLNMVWSFNETIEKYSIGSSFITTNDYYTENPVIIDACRNAFADARNMIVNEPEKAASAIAETLGVEVTNVLEAFTIMPFTDKFVGYDLQAQLMYEAGIINNEPLLLEEQWNYDDIK